MIEWCRKHSSVRQVAQHPGQIHFSVPCLKAAFHCGSGFPPRVEIAHACKEIGVARLRELGLNTDGDFERSLGRRLVESLPDA